MCRSTRRSTTASPALIRSRSVMSAVALTISIWKSADNFRPAPSASSAYAAEGGVSGIAGPLSGAERYAWWSRIGWSLR